MMILMITIDNNNRNNNYLSTFIALISRYQWIKTITSVHGRQDKFSGKTFFKWNFDIAYILRQENRNEKWNWNLKNKNKGWKLNGKCDQWHVKWNKIEKNEVCGKKKHKCNHYLNRDEFIDKNDNNNNNNYYNINAMSSNKKHRQ